jgi:hypothetical protein
VFAHRVESCGLVDIKKENYCNWDGNHQGKHCENKKNQT